MAERAIYHRQAGALRHAVPSSHCGFSRRGRHHPHPGVDVMRTPSQMLEAAASLRRVVMASAAGFAMLVMLTAWWN